MLYTGMDLYETTTDVTEVSKIIVKGFKNILTMRDGTIKVLHYDEDSIEDRDADYNNINLFRWIFKERD